MRRSFNPLLLLALPAMLLLSACDRNAPEDDHEDLGRVLIETRGTQTPQVIGEWTLRGGWQQQSLPSLTLGNESNNFGRASWTVRVFSTDGDELEMGTASRNPDGSRNCTEFSARYSVDNDQVLYNPGETGRVTVGGEARETFHCDHIHVYPRAAGTARMDIVLWHVDHADGRTTRIPIAVNTAPPTVAAN